MSCLQAGNRAGYNVASLQRSSRSYCSNRSRDSRVASRRSSSNRNPTSALPLSQAARESSATARSGGRL